MYKRIIACIIVKNGIAVQSIGFERYLPIGSPAIVAENLCRWGIDEIVLVDIDATAEDRGPDLGMVKDVAQQINVPLTVGGGITSLKQALQLLHAGADKLSINSCFLSDPELADKISWNCGNQCVIVSVDVTKNEENEYRVFSRTVPTAHGRLISDFLGEAAEYEIGELFVNSVENDGRRNGYDLELLEMIRLSTSLPIIALGGAGNAEHFSQALSIKGVAAAAANIFNHFEHSVTLIKKGVAESRSDVRAAVEFSYSSVELGDDSRPKRMKYEDLQRRLMSPIDSVG